MGKIICDICGTSYPDSGQNCPICGSSREYGTAEGFPELVREEKRKTAFSDIFAEDFYDYEENEVDIPLEPEDSYMQPSGRDKPNWGLIILFSVIICLLLAASGYLFLRYLLPHKLMSSKPTETTTETTLPPVSTDETTLPTVPCQSIVLTAGVPELSRIGQYWLLHTIILPENTTDQVSFLSADETVVTVTAEGRLCAVGEGETTVIISCGEERINCQVVVRIPSEEETLAAEHTSASQETATEEITEEDTLEAVETRPDGTVVLKLKESDISFNNTKKGVTHQLELDCDLDPKDIHWYTLDPYVALCHDGLLTITGPGTTTIGAKYQDQEVFCIVRVSIA